mmetsp:Transcript_7547/g.20905  ORF Transcript_7547/g.20905 Transcript_7547/m.20905 type:complete len:219 (+) Transcript_7547:650-1306(+)
MGKDAAGQWRDGPVRDARDGQGNEIVGRALRTPAAVRRKELPPGGFDPGRARVRAPRWPRGGARLLGDPGPGHRPGRQNAPEAHGAAEPLGQSQGVERSVERRARVMEQTSRGGQAAAPGVRGRRGLLDELAGLCQHLHERLHLPQGHARGRRGSCARRCELGLEAVPAEPAEAEAAVPLGEGPAGAERQGAPALSQRQASPARAELPAACASAGPRR